MTSCSGNSSGTTQNIQTSGSEDEVQVLIDQKKRKRMESNRESARRSRIRKQQHLDDLMAQVTRLRKANNQILTGISITTQQLLNVEGENLVLKAQTMELNSRLQSLNDILNYINMCNGVFEMDHAANSADCFMNPSNNLVYLC